MVTASSAFAADASAADSCPEAGVSEGCTASSSCGEGCEAPSLTAAAALFLPLAGFASFLGWDWAGAGAVFGWLTVLLEKTRI